MVVAGGACLGAVLTQLGITAKEQGAFDRAAQYYARLGQLYDDDVRFVHGNGGRLMTTPNGMMMGLGGNRLQDLYSQNGGTTWGDTFMLNIDNPKDPAQQLRDTARSGHAWYDKGDGPSQGELDLDRLLHHEERHSQQWAREGYTKFLASYAWERITGGNGTEKGAGLSDGGYPS